MNHVPELSVVVRGTGLPESVLLDIQRVIAVVLRLEPTLQVVVGPDDGWYTVPGGADRRLDVAVRAVAVE